MASTLFYSTLKVGDLLLTKDLSKDFSPFGPRSIHCSPPVGPAWWNETKYKPVWQNPFTVIFLLQFKRGWLKVMSTDGILYIDADVVEKIVKSG